MKNYIYFLATFIVASLCNAQTSTSYVEILLEGTPINVTDRKEQNPISQPRNTTEGQMDLPLSSNSMSGGSSISETTGELSVSLTGGATYTVPIKVPPGINGVVPTIALTYNSQGGNGLAGHGWNVSGISVISRIPSTKYHDANIDAVDFDNLDRFALDGQRLILKSGTYGGSGAIYETENFSNLKIVSNGTSLFGTPYGPLSFTVTYPDGSVATYGNSTDSRSRTDFAITNWQNPQGVIVEYSYTIADNSLSIASIKYGHRSSQTALNFIDFVYKTRKRPEQSFIGGIDFKRKSILSEIKVRAGTTGYRNYVLAHIFTTLGYEKLTSITEKSGDNTLSFSPITFNYTPETPSTLGSAQIVTTLSLSNIEQRNATMVPLEVNGDGKMDFIIYPKTKSERTKLWLFSNLQSGSNNIGTTISPLTIYEDVFPLSYINAVNQLSKTQGFALLTHTASNEVRFKVNGANGIGGFSQAYEKLWIAPSYQARNTCTTAPYTYRAPLKYLSGDFNGDGLTDVIAINNPYSYTNCVERVPTPTNPCSGGGGPQPIQSPTPPPGTTQNVVVQPAATGNTCCECSSSRQTTSLVYFINLDRRLSTGFVNTAGNLGVALKPADQLLSADVNGDGKADILHVSAGKMYAYTLSPSNGLTLLWTTTDTRIRTDYPLLLGDYNGDGKTDVMLPTAANAVNAPYATFLSTGTSFIKKELLFPFQYRTNTASSNAVFTYTLIPTDVNGDGRTDIIEYRTETTNTASNSRQYTILYANTFSTATDVTPAFASPISTYRDGNLYHYPIPVFLTSQDGNNGNLDFASISNNAVTYFTFNKDNRQDMTLNSIINNGVSQTITYRDMDIGASVVGLDGIKVYTDKSSQTFPYIDIGTVRGMKLVVGIDRVSSGTTSIRQVFSYEGAVSHADGLGFMGFQGLARSQWNTGNTDRIWDITKHDMVNRGAVNSSYTIPYTVNFTSIPSDYITRTSFINASSLSASKVFKITNTSNVLQNRLEGTAISTSYLYDTFNSPTKITVDYSGQGASVTDLTYGNSAGSPYYIGRPLTKKQTTTINGNAFNTEEQYIYTGNLVSTKNTKGNGTTFNTETYIYDVFGNITKKVTTPFGTPAREVNFTYDTSGRYLLTSRDVESLITTFEYNTTTGTLKKETNPYALATQYFYDGWNRLTKVTDYLGKNANTTYVEVSNAYTVTVSADDGGSTITNYDPLQRVSKVSQKDVLGQWISKSYQYDKFDRTWKESEPFIGTTGTQWNTTEYDFYGRPKTLTSYSGKITNITYTNQSISVNDGTKTVVTTKDAMGNVTQVTDPGGTIAYTYFGNGALKTSTFSGITMTMEQDGWGRKTKLIDPSAGTYTYEYNGFGEMTKEITPKGNTVYLYSTLGKLERKTVTGDAATNMIINYTYDPLSKLPKTVALTTNADGNTGLTTINYDGSKRVSSTVETGTYATYTKTFVYDSFGRVDTEQSDARLLSNNKTSSVKVKNTYAFGQLKSVKDNTSNEELWNITGLNSRGQVTTATMGVGMRRTNTYDTNGYLTQALSQKNVTTSAVELMKLTFAFNTQRGILNSRTNAMFAWTENFTYDSQNRLLNFNDNNGAKNQNYDTKGRIDVNSQIGQYKYGTTNFQQTELVLNPTGQTYYNNYTAQNITYNSFKSPVEITENGKDRINFQYNAAMGRATMFYGDTNSDKLLRPFRKHYSSDGSMEIKWEKATGKTTFVTYMGGDGYSSSVIYHSEHTGTSTNTAQYLYLHRDYLGSILAITDKVGNFREKRHFDAWGNIVKLTDGNNVALTKFAILDRGYTGHEHLQGVGLVHMNGRLYDPMLHRFLMPDNFVQDIYNTTSYNRYGYAMHNPLMYTDASGELVWAVIIVGAIIGGATGAAAYIGSAARTQNWNWGEFGLSILGGAALGAFSAGQLPASISIGYVATTVATGFMAGLMPSINISSGNWNFSISPAIAFGKGFGAGANFSVGFNDGNFSVSGGYGISYYGSAHGTGSSGWESRKSWGANWGDGKNSFGLYSTSFKSGETSQRVGGLSYGNGDFNFRYENDGTPFGGWSGDGGDSFRSAAIQVSYKDFSAGFNLFTGNREFKDDLGVVGKMESDAYGRRFPNGFVGEKGTPYRLGALYVAYKGARVGTDSEHVRHAVQDQAIHNLNIFGIVDKRQPGFRNQSWTWNPYFQYQSANPYTLW
jgi:RHS repeat-associated protein